MLYGLLFSHGVWVINTSYKLTFSKLILSNKNVNSKKLIKQSKTQLNWTAMNFSKTHQSENPFFLSYSCYNTIVSNSDNINHHWSDLELKLKLKLKIKTENCFPITSLSTPKDFLLFISWTTWPFGCSVCFVITKLCQCQTTHSL